MCLSRALSLVVWRECLRLVSVGVLSGLMVGFAAALGARLVMRIIALAIGRAPQFNLIPTLGLLHVGFYFGILMGLLFVAIRKYLPGSGLTKGLAFGVLLLLLFVLLFFLPPPGELLDTPLLGSILFSVLCLMTGIAETIAVAWLERFLPAPRRRLPSIVGYGLFTLLAVSTVLRFMVENVVPFVTGLLRLAGFF